MASFNYRYAIYGISIAGSIENVFMSNSTRLKLGSPWEEVKAKIKERNIHLTDEDLTYEEGKEDELLERLSKKMKKNKQEVKEFIESVSFNRGVAG